MNKNYFKETGKMRGGCTPRMNRGSPKLFTTQSPRSTLLSLWDLRPDGMGGPEACTDPKPRSHPEKGAGSSLAQAGDPKQI